MTEAELNELINRVNAALDAKEREMKELRATVRLQQEEITRLRLTLSVALPLMEAQDIFSKPLRKLEVVE